MAGLVMKIAVSIMFYLTPDNSCFTQESSARDTSIKDQYKPGIFTNGFIDIMNNGQLNASARLIRIYVGEPGKLAIPLSIYTGVSANNFQDQLGIAGQRNNDHLLGSFLNPLSGLLNFGGDGIFYFRNSNELSMAGIPYNFGERVLTGFKAGPATDPQTGKPINFLNSYFSTGLYFQTGAWEKTNMRNVGLFWLVCRWHSTYSHPNLIRSFLQIEKTNGIYLGYSIGFGVHINNLLNLRAIYYKYTKAPEIAYTLPIYQFTFNYSFKE
jgi:hypothetical protein